MQQAALQKLLIVGQLTLYPYRIGMVHTMYSRFAVYTQLAYSIFHLQLQLLSPLAML